MITVSTILIICALVCFLLAAFGVPTRINLVALGLSFLTAAFLISRGVLIGQ